MILHYFLDYRFFRTPNGATWTDTSYDLGFWEPHLLAFDHVNIVSRVSQVSTICDGWLRVDGVGVSVWALPDYHGVTEYLKSRLRVQRSIRDVLKEPGAVIVRVPSPLATNAVRELESLGRCYSVDVVGDSPLRSRGNRTSGVPSGCVAIRSGRKKSP